MSEQKDKDPIRLLAEKIERELLEPDIAANGEIRSEVVRHIESILRREGVRVEKFGFSQKVSFEKGDRTITGVVMTTNHMTIEQIQRIYRTATTDTWHQHSNGGGWVANTATVPEGVCVPENSVVGGYAVISNSVVISDNVRIGYGVVIGNSVRIGDNVVIGDNVRIGDYVVISDYVRIGDYAVIGGDVVIGDYVRIGGDAVIGDYAEILHQSDLIELRNVGTGLGVLALYRRKTGIGISRGCYRNGTLEDFLSRLTDCPEHEFYRQVVPLMHAGLLRRMTPLADAAEKGEVKP